MPDPDQELKQHLIERILYVGIFKITEGEKQIVEKLGLVYYSRTRAVSMINPQPEVFIKRTPGMIVDITV